MLHVGILLAGSADGNREDTGEERKQELQMTDGLFILLFVSNVITHVIQEAL